LADLPFEQSVGVAIAKSERAKRKRGGEVATMLVSVLTSVIVGVQGM
jgi:hypothetical protein